MYTIKQAAARTGLSVPVIRAWERRYGVVAPIRTPAGYRLYDEAAIARLVAMRHLVVEEGWRPSQASVRVLDPTVDPVASSADSAQAAAEPEAPRYPIEPDDAAGAGERTASHVAAFLAAARALDVPAMGRILDDVFAAQRFELAIEGVVAPALHAIGSAWVRDDIDVGAEHAASETIRRRLARFFDAAARDDRPPRVIVGLPPDGYHEIGAFAFAVAARRAGLDVLYLGANVPVESWLRTVRETGAPIVALGVVTPADVTAARAVVDALRASERPPICLVGGPLAPAPLGALDSTRLPVRLDDAVAVIVAILRVEDDGPPRIQQEEGWPSRAPGAKPRSR